VAEDVPVAIPDKQVGSDEEAAVAVEEPPDGDVRDEDSAPRVLVTVATGCARPPALS
jgi:hypothetical protein